jgi:hypothetical protein
MEAAYWYEHQRAGLGRAFRLDLEAALDRVSNNPKQYGVDLEPFRACPLHRFPYILHYLELSEVIWILAAAHQSRRPGYWQDRVNKP